MDGPPVSNCGRNITLSARSNVPAAVGARAQLARSPGPDRHLRRRRPAPGRVHRVGAGPGAPARRLPAVHRRILLLDQGRQRGSRTSTSPSWCSDPSSPRCSAPSSATCSGDRYGTRLFKPDARLFKTEYLERAQGFFDRSGPRAVVLARFIPFVRTIVPMLAGTSRMPQRAFATANIVGAALWAVGVSLLGYLPRQADRRGQHRQVPAAHRRGDHRARR